MAEIKIRDVVDVLMTAKDNAERRRVLAERFPDLSGADFERAVAIAKDELHLQRQENQEAADALDIVAQLRESMPDDVSFEDHIRAKADRGDALAAAYLAHLNSPSYRLHSALVDEAFRRHPDWEVHPNGGFKFVGQGTPPAFVDETALIDWLQTNHPAVAREIEQRVQA